MENHTRQDDKQFFSQYDNLNWRGLGAHGGPSAEGAYLIKLPPAAGDGHLFIRKEDKTHRHLPTQQVSWISDSTRSFCVAWLSRPTSETFDTGTGNDIKNPDKYCRLKAAKWEPPCFKSLDGILRPISNAGLHVGLWMHANWKDIFLPNLNIYGFLGQTVNFVSTGCCKPMALYNSTQFYVSK